VLKKHEKKIILPYSLKNNKVKEREEYSVLNPETNSLSPSAKSKGARLVSLIMLKTHKKKSTKKRIKLLKENKLFFRLNLF
jgi:hypothetical protein